MKKAILIFAVLLIARQSIFCQALQIARDTSTGLVSYTEIVYADSLSKRELFGRALEWITLNYKSANNVIQLKDEDRGKIILKGNFKETKMFRDVSLDVTVEHTIIISVKDGRSKIQITDINCKTYNPGASGSVIGNDYSPVIAASTTDRRFEEEINLYATQTKQKLKDMQLNFIKDCDKELHSTLNSYSAFLQKPDAKKGDEW